MSTPWLPALLGFLGAIVGGLVNAFFTRRHAKDQFVRDARLRDYNLFVEAIAGLSQAGSKPEDRKPFVAKTIEAKAKIILNSSAAVLDALDRYSSHQALATEQSYTDFAKLLEAMRADIGGEPDARFEAKVRAIVFEGSRA